MIYTGNGDNGDTIIISVRLPKHHPCIHFIGSVDEAMASTGLAIELVEDTETRRKLEEIYWILSKIAGALYTHWCPGNELIRELEKRIDRAAKPRLFIPNFSKAGGVAPVAVVRTAIRRAERWFWACMDETGYGCRNLGILLNRLSDYAFIIQYESLLKTMQNK